MANDTARQLHQRADALLNSNNLAEARDIYRQICTRDASDAEARMMLGAIEAELGRINDALYYLREAIRIRPDYADPYHTLAHLLVHQGKPGEACEALSRAVEADPGFTAAWEMLGGLQGQQQDFAAAERSCRKALELDGDLLASRLNLANALMEQGKDEEAIDRFRDLTNSQPALAPAWSRLGALLVRQGRAEDAVQALNRALRLSPDDHESKQALAYALTQTGNYATAIPLLREVLEVEADAGSCWFALLACYRESGELTSLLAFCDRLSEVSPASKYPLFIKGMILERLNRPAAALACYRTVTGLAPDWPDGWGRAGTLQLALGDIGPAEQCLKRALSLGSDDPAVFNCYAQTKSLRGDYAESERYARLALEKSPGSLKSYTELGAALQAQGRLDEAIDALKKGLTIMPDHPDLVGMLAGVHERKGEYEKAYELIRPYLESGSREPALVTAFAVIGRRLGKAGQALEAIRLALASESGLSNFQRAKLHFSAGDLYDEFGKADEAMDHYHRANQLTAASFNPDGFSYLVDETIRVFNGDSLRKLSLFGNASERPVFIVGMPRSGTSLLEQILATHPDVFAAGELQEMRAIAMELGLVPRSIEQKVRTLEGLRPDNISKAANRYLGVISALAQGEPFVVDKMPSNFLALGLIQVLFPRAKIIHAMRDPMDTCLSCYFSHFGSSNGFAYSLDDLGFYYSEYQRLMAHWRQVLSLDFLDVQYEDLVTDQPGQTRRLLAFCGLDWDERVLDFHDNNRVVRTLSYDQVRQPIYTSSVDRWKAYEAHLGPLRDALTKYGL